jgi:hydroxypyruvate isomerase
MLGRVAAFRAQVHVTRRLEALMPSIDHMQLADVPGRHEPGTGEINYGNIYKKLAQLNYKHMAAMEFRPSRDPVEKLRAAKNEVIKAATA